VTRTFSSAAVNWSAIRLIRPDNAPTAADDGLKIEAVPTPDLRTRLTQQARVAEVVVDKKTNTKSLALTHPPAWLERRWEASGATEGGAMTWVGWWRPNKAVRYTRIAEAPTYDLALERLLDALASVKGGETVILHSGVDPGTQRRPFAAGGKRLL
jgi:hypothetical protein